MKVTVKDKAPRFTPIDVIITVESEDDYKLLMDISRRDEKVPEIVHAYGGNYVGCQRFLQALRKAVIHANR